MPSTSTKQHRFMEAIAHNSAFAKKAGVPQSVGKDFSAADKGRTFSKGGATMMKKSGKEAMMAMAARSAMRRPPMAPMASQAPTPMASQAGMPGMKKGGKVDTKKPNPFMEMIAKKKEKAEGESPSFQKKEGKKGEKAEMKFAKGGGIESKGKTKGTIIRMASGGSVSSRADGIASRGKTNCKIC